MTADPCQLLCEQVAQRVRPHEVFTTIELTDRTLRCQARITESQAFYMVQVSENLDVVWVGYYTRDRWLSESIEADLMHSGDKIEELLAEELCDQGFEGNLPVEHFRDESKQYVFRSPLRLAGAQTLNQLQTLEQVTAMLLAYEACISQLGNMSKWDDRH